MVNEDFQVIVKKVEAVLFSYADWISISEIMQIVSVDSESFVLNSLKELEQKFKVGFSFEVVTREDGRWKMQLKSDYDSLAASIVVGTEIPKEVLKVLSVIAYDQPITKTRLCEILGKSSVKNEILYLKEHKFISSEKNGVGTYYRLTKKFYDYFSAEGDSDFRQKANESLTTFLKDSKQIAIEAKNILASPTGVVSSVVENKSNLLSLSGNGQDVSSEK